MKRPNFRLHETQATTSFYVGILSLLGIAALTYCVFKGFNFEYQSIPYNAKEGYGKIRPYLVFGGTAMSLLTGLVAGLFGFNSLGQKRNNKQGYSWLGMFAGAFSMSLAPLLFFVWQRFSESAILAG